jgi:hypothetical protein
MLLFVAKKNVYRHQRSITTTFQFGQDGSHARIVLQRAEAVPNDRAGRFREHSTRQNWSVSRGQTGRGGGRPRLDHPVSFSSPYHSTGRIRFRRSECCGSNRHH